MTIDRRVIDSGFTEESILYLHSRTRLSSWDINSVEFVSVKIIGGLQNIKLKQNTLFTIRLQMYKNSRKRQMSIDVTESKLLLISRDIKLKSLGI